MSESKGHRELIRAMAENVETRYPKMRLKKDILEKPGDAVPPNINNFKPDVFAVNRNRSFHVICEAKTDIDLEIEHTNLQLQAFLSYIETKGQGLLILGILGQKADRAKTMLHFLNQELEPKATKFEVFDGLDYWELVSARDSQWHLI